MTPHKLLTPRFVFPALLLLIFLGIGSLLYALTPLSSILNALFTPNYAEQTAKPLEKALVEAGAVKVSGGGDNGMGMDNERPGYTVRFTTHLNEDHVNTLVHTIMAQNGYNLIHATKENKGPLAGIADRYFDGIYYDFASKKSNFAILKEGPIELWIDINIDNSDTDLNQTSIQLDIELPERK